MRTSCRALSWCKLHVHSKNWSKLKCSDILGGEIVISCHLPLMMRKRSTAVNFIIKLNVRVRSCWPGYWLSTRNHNSARKQCYQWMLRKLFLSRQILGGLVCIRLVVKKSALHKEPRQLVWMKQRRDRRNANSNCHQLIGSRYAVPYSDETQLMGDGERGTMDRGEGCLGPLVPRGRGSIAASGDENARWEKKSEWGLG